MKEELDAVEGLGSRADRLLLGDTLAGWQEKIRSKGVFLAEDTVCSPEAARLARKIGRTHGPTALTPGGIAVGKVAAFCGGPGTLGFGDPSQWKGSHPLPPAERVLPGIVVDGGPLGIADAWCLPVRHWVQLLWANLLGLPSALWDGLLGRDLLTPARLFWALLRARSFAPSRLGAVLVHREPGADVHPKATVEGTILGKGARIGAGAVVRGAILGEGAVVEELAMVEGVVMGEGARVQRMAMSKYSVIEAGAMFGGIMQLGVIGRGAVVKHGAVLMDMTLNGRVRAKVEGALKEVPFGMVGVCVGEKAVVASGVRVAPGRVIRGGLTVLGGPENVLSDVSVSEGCREAVVRDGRLLERR